MLSKTNPHNQCGITHEKEERRGDLIVIAKTPPDKYIQLLFHTHPHNMSHRPRRRGRTSKEAYTPSQPFNHYVVRIYHSLVVTLLK
jgi:hypothetical protein